MFRPELPRRALVALPLALAGCTDDGPVRTDFPALSYEFLTPLRLGIAEVEVRDQSQPGSLGARAPVPPAAALRQMATDRLKPGGSTGRAVFTIIEARIDPAAGGVVGNMAVQLDIRAADGARAGYAEARVQRRRSGTREAELRATLYDLVRDMMDDMNVEFEFQVRHALHDWLQETTTAPAPAAVQQQDLSAPPRVR